MNRTARILAAALYLGLSWASAGAQVPLVVGSVRDQHGAPIQAASVAAFDSQGRRLGSAVTDGSGTFSLPGDGVSAVAVSCRFCLGRRFSIVAGEPVVAILRRFDALFYDTPSVGDLASLPYANVESAMALRPFTLLRQTTEVLPGPQLADRGLLPTDTLLIDAGVPNYDFSLGTSPYYAIPTAYEGSGSIASPASAFRYGDQAGSGIVTLDPFAGDSAGVLTIGGDAALRVMAGSPTFRAVAGISGGGGQSRERADGQWTIPLSDAQSLSLSGGASQYHESGPLSTLDGNFSFANLGFDDVQRTTETHAAFILDRGAYLAGSARIPIGNVWSDAQFSAGIRTNGSIAAFAEASSRLSTGIYDATALTQPRIAGTLTQNRIDAGIDAVGTGFDATAGVGFFGFGYTGGSTGVSLPSNGHLATPSLSLRLLPNRKFSGTLEASGAFTLPNLWEQFADYLNAGALVYDRSTVYAATLSYTDDVRLRASVETASQRVSGNVNGLVTSSGVSLAWQLAPAISLRAWTMYVADATVPLPGAPYAAGEPSNINALWITYENGPNVRLDAIYRRDLLDGGPFRHVDASVSGPIAGRLRWYAGVEDRRHTTYLGVGLRFSQ